MSLKGLLKNVKEVFLASKRGYIILLTKFKSRYFLFILLLSRIFFDKFAPNYARKNMNLIYNKV